MRKLKNGLKKTLLSGNSWTNQAISKLNKFVDYIALDDLVTAEKWALKLIEKTDQLIEQPESGRIDTMNQIYVN